MEMGGTKNNASWISLVLLFYLLSLSLLPRIQCADGDDDETNPSVLPIVTQKMYERLSNVTTDLTKDIKSTLGFCIKDVYVTLSLAL